MTKAELALTIHKRLGFSKHEASGHVEALLSLVKSILERGEKLKISGFGNFEIKQKQDRRGRNPQTGEPITLAARKILVFKPSKSLRQVVNADAQ